MTMSSNPLYFSIDSLSENPIKLSSLNYVYIYHVDMVVIIVGVMDDKHGMRTMLAIRIWDRSCQILAVARLYNPYQ